MLYNVIIKAKVESNLTQEIIESQLVIALHNVDDQYSKLDGVDENLEVLDYDLTEANEICPHDSVK